MNTAAWRMGNEGGGTSATREESKDSPFWREELGLVTGNVVGTAL